MKLSKYNRIQYIGDDTIIYNTATSGVLMLDKKYSEEFRKLQEFNNFSNEKLVTELKKAQIVLDDSVDEVKNVQLSNLVNRFDSTRLSLTIAPTLECNFACPYCYEEGVRYNDMDSSIQDGIIDFIKDHKTISRLSVCWYGGEPLLKLDIIRNLTNRILENLGDLNYSAAIVTNGYLLNKDVALELKELKINSVQVTIDGVKEIHNLRRKLVSGEGTFDTIINNLKECCEIIPIVVRINVDRTNIAGVNSLVEFFEESGLLNKIKFYLAPVDDMNSSCKNKNCFDMKEFSEEEINFYQSCLKRGVRSFQIPKSYFGICGAVSLNSYVIDPKGDLYKCWDEIGRYESSVGNVLTGVESNSRLADWLLHNPGMENEECRECDVLPICYGGCAYHIMKKGDHKCSSIRFNSEKVVELLYNDR